MERQQLGSTFDSVRISDFTRIISNLPQFPPSAHCSKCLAGVIGQNVAVVQVALHGGAPNKNIGDAFLLVWKFPKGCTVEDIARVTSVPDSTGQEASAISAILLHRPVRSWQSCACCISCIDITDTVVSLRPTPENIHACVPMLLLPIQSCIAGKSSWLLCAPDAGQAWYKQAASRLRTELADSRGG